MKTKTTKIIYWSGAIFMSLWFGASGFFELTKNSVVWDITQQLGYPPHFIYILGVFKIAGVLVLLLPNRLLRLKEWVFAGMFFDILFAFFSKIAVWFSVYGRCNCCLFCVNGNLHHVQKALFS